jgi:hypothetical protein
MRILMVSRVVARQRPGGMPHVAADSAAALAAAGHEVHLVTTFLSPQDGATGAVLDVHAGDGVCYHFTAAPAHRWTAEFARYCEVWARELAPDVVCLQSFDRENLWWHGLKCRTAVVLHGFGVGALLTRWNLYRTGLRRQMPSFDGPALKAEAGALAKADAVLAVSRWEWRMLRDQYGLPRARVVPNPLPAYFWDAPEPGARTKARRDGYFLCAAVSGQAERGFAQAQAACARAGVPFREVCDVPRERMPAQYDGARALLLVSNYAQGADLSLAESRARGVPAILSPTGSYLDEARPWDRHAELGDVDGLAALLRGYEPPAVPPGAADAHRPERHAAAWLGAVAG